MFTMCTVAVHLGLQFYRIEVLVSVASLLENWILEGDEQGNFSMNAFVFLSNVFGLIFLEQSYE